VIGHAHIRDISCHLLHTVSNHLATPPTSNSAVAACGASALVFSYHLSFSGAQIISPGLRMGRGQDSVPQTRSNRRVSTGPFLAPAVKSVLNLLKLLILGDNLLNRATAISDNCVSPVQTG